MVNKKRGVLREKYSGLNLGERGGEIPSFYLSEVSV